MQQKKDNQSLVKMVVREHGLDKYHHEGPIDVLDCCQGEGLIWTRLRKRWTVRTYFGVDVKRKAGRVRCSAERIVSHGCAAHNVIDIDTYGEPWSIWSVFLSSWSGYAATVFLTRGRMTSGCGNISRVAASAMSIPESMYKKIPRGIVMKLPRHADAACLALPYRYGITIVEAWMASHNTMDYYGIRLERSK